MTSDDVSSPGVHHSLWLSRVGLWVCVKEALQWVSKIVGHPRAWFMPGCPTVVLCLLPARQEALQAPALDGRRGQVHRSEFIGPEKV